MKTLLTAVVAAVIAFTGVAQAKDWGKGSTVRIATEGAYAPWNHKDSSGKLVGFEIDLAADLCKRMKMKCEMIERLWKGTIAALRAGEFDAIMTGVSITEKRKKLIAFSRSYAATPAVFVVKSDGPFADFSTKVDSVTMDSIDAAEKAAIAALKNAFAGKTVGAQVATTLEHFLKTHMADAIKVRTYDIQGNVDRALRAGRVDAALAEMSYWKPLLESDKGKGLKIIGPGFTGGPFGAGTGVGVRQEDQALADMFSAAINGAINDGVLSRLALKWFGFDISPKD